MKRNMKISTQLQVGSVIILVFVILLGVVAYVQTDSIYQQARNLYEHPFQVREAVDQIKADILTARVASRDFVLYDDEKKQLESIETIRYTLNDAQQQFEVLRELYLGPASDIEAAYQSLILWQAAIEDRISMAQAGETEDIIQSLGDGGEVGKKRLLLSADIETIHTFAVQKADELNLASIEQYNSLQLRYLSVILATVLMSILISTHLIREIRKPLTTLTGDIEVFRSGDLETRCRYTKRNEFGTLSAAFNAMADTIQQNMDISGKAASLSSAMLRNENIREFFRTMLTELMQNLHANTAAVYLLDKDQKTYVCYDSIGLNGEAKQSFDAQALEGELGLALSTRKVQRIQEIPEGSRIRFSASLGQLSPRELLTIPIVSGGRVAAVFSFSTINRFYPHTDELIETIIDTMSARIEGILASQTVKDMLVTLEQQNRELDMQKSELSRQATELTQQNAELDLQKNQLAEVSRLKTNFLSNMSHELRTPLNSIIALSGVLNRRLSGQIPEEEHGYVEIVERNGKHLLELINDILDISRIEAGREEVDVSDFDINRTLSELVTMLEPLARQKNIRLAFTPEAPEIRMACDEPKCRHILQNIIGNAVKFTETGSVEITAQIRDQSAVVTVKDTGIGIDPKYMVSIFNEFSQADGTTSRKFGGTGLGLAIAKKYAELLGGAINVASTLGQGSTFTVVLPLRCTESEREPEAAAAAPEPAISAGPGGNTLLLIEDSDSAIIQIKDLMEESGYRLQVAHNAREAFASIDLQIPDAIILDLMMPEVDGFDVLRTLRAQERTVDVPVLILTAKHVTHQELKDLRKNNVYQIIQKGGVDRGKLLSVVSGMLHPAPPQTAPSALPAEKPTENEKKPRILIVEDNPDNMTTLKALLGDKYELFAAEDGEKGVTLARDLTPDLVLMDIALPVKNGIEAFHDIRDGIKTQRIPVVALTASVMTQERSAIMSHGFNAFVAKPLIAEELYRVIREVLYD